MTEKRKNIQHIGRKTFLLAWLGTGILALTIEWILHRTVRPFIASDIPHVHLVSLLFFSIAILVISIIHQWLLGRAFGIFIKYWWILSTIAWVVGYTISGEIFQYLGMQLFVMDTLVRDILFSLAFVILFSLPCLVQAYLLHPYVMNAWLFVVIILITGFVFRSIAMGFISRIETVEVFLIISLIFNEIIFYVVTSGLTLLWLNHVTYDDDMMIAEA